MIRFLPYHTDEKGTASKIWRGVTRMVKYKSSCLRPSDLRPNDQITKSSPTLQLLRLHPRKHLFDTPPTFSRDQPIPIRHKQLTPEEWSNIIDLQFLRPRF